MKRNIPDELKRFNDPGDETETAETPAEQETPATETPVTEEQPA